MCVLVYRIYGAFKVVENSETIFGKGWIIVMVIMQILIEIEK